MISEVSEKGTESFFFHLNLRVFTYRLDISVHFNLHDKIDLSCSMVLEKTKE